MKDNINSKEALARFRNLSWDKTKTFYVVARMGTISKAAKYFHIAQSAVSRQIIDLERALGMMLFIREPRGVRLTRKGEELYSIIKTNFLNLVEFTRNTHAEIDNIRKRKIRIAAPHAIITYVLDTHILAYNRENPHLTFELISDNHMIDIVLNDVDIAIRPFDPDAQEVYQEPLFTLEKKLFASQSYIDKYGEPQTEFELKDHHIIAHANPEEHPYSDLQWILKLGMPEGEQQKPAFTSNSLEISVKAAEEGIGIIGCYKEMRIIKESKLKNILPELKDKKIKDYFIYPKHLQNDQQIMKLRDYLHSIFIFGLSQKIDS